MPSAPVAITILLAFGILALIILLLLIRIRYAFQSLKAASLAAKSVAAGDVETRLTAAAGELALAFNTMTSNLKVRLDELTTRQEELSTTLDTMADGVIVIDEDDRILLINRSAERLLNLTQNRPAKSYFIEIIRDYELLQLVDKAQKSGVQQHREVEMFNPRVFLSAIATPLKKEYRSSGVLLTLHDLTPVRQLETTRREFVSNVSHELRNPLASIKAMVETLEDGALKDPVTSADFLGRIHKEVDRMTALVSDLLELSRLESGQSALEVEPVDMTALIEDVVRMFKEQALAKGISIHDRQNNEAVYVLGNEPKLREVLINLVENAIKFTSRGEISISTAQNGKHLAVSVQDTGEGIAEEHLPHIFERFYKVERSRSYGGTGLGLAIAKHIIQLHKGEISAESKEGQGSKFTFSVPLHSG